MTPSPAGPHDYGPRLREPREQAPIVVEEVPAFGEYALVVHAGAGARPEETDAKLAAAYDAGLRAALAAGAAVLARGGAALEAVVAAVRSMEDCEQFNAGRGAALTADGTAELDAAVMTGEGLAGAVACARDIRNPVLAARAVAERTPHVLMAAPTPDQLASWGIERVEPAYFITDRRRAQLAASGRYEEHRHGTVGAVARDRAGRIAAATSTGGVTAQLPGRVGDTPVIGAGTYADATTCAVSCTGVGEFFVRAVLAHDVSARMRYGGARLPEAARAAIETGLASRGGDGALIAVTATGEAVLAGYSPGLLRGALTAGGPVTAA